MARDDTALSILFSLLASPSIEMRNHAATPTAWDDAVPFLAQVTSDEHKWVTSQKRRRERVGETDGDSHAMFFSLSVHAGVWPACTG